MPILTDIYALVPTYVLVIELTSCALTPKSHNLTSPWVLTNILDGFTSAIDNNTGTLISPYK